MVVDETSMVDVILASKLIKAVAPGARLLLAGDVNQLPSVGAGEVLSDLLAAGSLPAVRLTKIFRQAQQSGIVVNAHRINAGRPPILGGFGDFFWFGCEDTEQTAALVTDIVARRIPARFGLDPRRDVQVLCPVHRGPAGAGNLNLLPQGALTRRVGPGHRPRLIAGPRVAKAGSHFWRPVTLRAASAKPCFLPGRTPAREEARHQVRSARSRASPVSRSEG